MVLARVLVLARVMVLAHVMVLIRVEWGAWVTQLGRPKDAKDEVKRLEGPPARSRGPEGPQTSSIQYFLKA